MNYSTKIKLITTLIIATSLGIGYWFGVIVSELFNDDFASSEYTVPGQNTLELQEAQREIEELKNQISKISDTESDEAVEHSLIRSPELDAIPVQQQLNQDNDSETTILATHEAVQSVEEPGGWIPVSTLNIQHALNQGGLETTSIDELKCNLNICLARFKHNDNQAHYQLLLRLGSIQEFSKGFVIKSDTDNKQETIVLFPRSSQQMINKVSVSYRDTNLNGIN
ncbi:MAG: hypothetical protein K0U68_04830 [Gammaproteobacteria bacterium]|nr:hypothetical protein [Gammaproteobacteria bacterium]